MKKLFSLILSSFIFSTLVAQNLYFPPKLGNNWDTISPNALGWCPDKIDSLTTFLDQKNTKAFIVLKDGKIVMEEYFDTFTQDSLWYWASAGKTLTTLLTGIAQEQGNLSITDKTSDYLGTGWTSLTPAQEDLITIWHQLTMTSGMDDSGLNAYCTDSSCLQYLADAGTRWAYHNAPYTLLRDVIESATGQNYNTYTTFQVKTKTGMDGFWLKVGYNNLFFSTARSMARFGLLMQNKGVWDNTIVLGDTAYLNAAINTSQNLNESYGYLWWLNGKNAHRLPGLQFNFNGSLSPTAPADMYSGVGKDGQIVSVIPSKGLVVVRMGNNPDNSLVPINFQNEMWDKLNDVFCNSTTTKPTSKSELAVNLYPNPASSWLTIDLKNENINDFQISVRNVIGQVVEISLSQNQLNVTDLVAGVYFLTIGKEGIHQTIRFVKQ